MEPATELTPAVLLTLLPECELALRAEDKSAGTLEAYVRGYLEW